MKKRKQVKKELSTSSNKKRHGSQTRVYQKLHDKHDVRLDEYRYSKPVRQQFKVERSYKNEPIRLYQKSEPVKSESVPLSSVSRIAFRNPLLVPTCVKRAIRKRVILAMSRGRGLRVKRAKWSPDSSVVCS